MKNTSFNAIIFNAAGLGLVVFLAGYMLNSALRTEEVVRCSMRYGDGHQFSLQNSEGEVLSPMELQARVPTREWGLLEKARVVETPDKKALFLQVALGPVVQDGAAAQEEDAEAENKPQDGVGFVWQPQNLSGARAGCLSYRLFMSKDIDFGKPGTLPGLYALDETAKLDAQELDAGFISKLGWEKGGVAGVTLRTPQTAGMWIEARDRKWPANSWVSIEQEVALNTPGKEDGLMRVWIDGQLTIEHKRLNLGANESSMLAGVVSDVGYKEAAAQPARLTLSPFVVQRQ